MIWIDFGKHESVVFMDLILIEFEFDVELVVVGVLER